MNGERVIVTGGCGYVGSSLSRQLVEAGNDVMIVDDFSVSVPENLDPETASKVQITQLDINDTENLKSTFEGFQPSAVFHLAALHFIPACDKNPTKAIHINVEGTQSLFDAAAATPSVQSVVITSTAAVYQPSDDSHSEESTVGPSDIYGLTKLWDEQLAALFHRKTQIPVGIARLFNVFGPGETNPHLIPAIIKQLASGNDLHLGNLTTKRDYIYVDDVAAALIKLGVACREYGTLTCNVGSEREIDGHELIDTIARILNRELTIHTNPARVRKSDRPHLLSDCTRAHEKLGWSATTSLEEGLQAAFERPLVKHFMHEENL
jgi:UDP-glucose 4-epimerase